MDYFTNKYYSLQEKMTEKLWKLWKIAKNYEKL